MPEDQASEFQPGQPVFGGYSGLIGAQAQIINNIDGDKNKAAHAMQMAQGDQETAAYVYGNYDLAAKAYQARAAQEVIARNTQLQTYFNNNKMASLVSKDDIANLADYTDSSEKMKNIFRDPWLDYAGMAFKMAKDDPTTALGVAAREFLHGLPAMAASIPGAEAGMAVGAGAGAFGGPAAPVTVPVGGFLGGLVGGIGSYLVASAAERKAVQDFFPSEARRLERGEAEHPIASEIGGLASALPFFGVGGLGAKAIQESLKSRAITGGVMGTIDAVQQQYATGEIDPVHLAGATIGGALLIGKPTMFGRAFEAESIARAFDTGAFLARFGSKGEKPPLYVNPVHDHFVAQDTVDAMGVYDENIRDAEKSETRTLSPELWKKLNDQFDHSKDTIGLSWEAVDRMYGDRVPTSGDGMLGDIPGITEQFNRSKKFTGEDIQVPWHAWTAASEEVHAALHDFVRLPGHFTLAEARAVPDPATAWHQVPDALPQHMEDQQLINDTRKAAGLDPIVTDHPPQKLVLVPRGPDTLVEARHPDTLGDHSFSINDQDGRRVGDLELTPKKGGKELHVSWIGAAPRQSINPRHLFGTQLIGGLGEQIREMFPQATHITGNRIDGLKENLASDGSKVSVNLDALMQELEGKTVNPAIESEVQKIASLINAGEWVKFSPNVAARIAPREWTDKDTRLSELIDNWASQNLPNTVRIVGAKEAELKGRKVQGLWQAYRDRTPLILYALDAKDPLGTIRHEAIHHLKNYGYITNDEWHILADQAVRENWIGKHDIDERYDGRSESQKIEEAVAEEFAEWGTGQKVAPKVDGVFGKIKEILDKIKEFVREVFGTTNAEDIFGRIERGEVAAREATTAPEGAQMPPKAQFPDEEPVPEVGKEPRTFEKGVMPMAKRAYDRLVAGINAVNAKDVRRRLAKEEKQAAARRSEAWNKEAAEMYPEVASDVDSRPDMRAWKFMTNGELGGVQFGLKPKLDPKSMSAEQLKDFPQHWLSDNGINIDQVASGLGFRTGDDFVADMMAFRSGKGDMTFNQFRDRAIQAEIKRRMESKYGNFESLNAEEARQHVAGMKEEDMLWDRYRFLATQAGVAPSLDRDAVRAMAKIDFGNRPAARATLKNVVEEMGRNGNRVNNAWNGAQRDPLAAFHATQQQLHLMAQAREAAAFEQRRKADARVIFKPLRKAQPTNMDPEYADWAHQIMLNHQIPTERSQENIDEVLARPERQFKTFADFVNSKNVPVDPADPISVGLPLGYQDYGTTYNPDFPVWDRLLDPTDPINQKSFDELTVTEYKGITNALRVLKKVGQDQSKGMVMLGDKEVVAKEFAEELAAEFARFGTAKSTGSKFKLAALSTFRWTQTKLMTADTLLSHISSQDPHGPAARLLAHIARADGEAKRLAIAELAPRLEEVLGSQPQSWWHKRVDNNSILHPIMGTPLNLDNDAIVALHLVTGSQDAIAHTAAGYKMKPEDLLAYRDSVATKEHLDVAKKIADLFEWAQGHVDDMTMKRSGTILEKEQPGMIQTKFGEMPGWYYPRKRDTAIDPPGLEKDFNPVTANINATMPHSFMMERTGQQYAVKLNTADLANDLRTRLNYATMQPILDIFNKVLRRKEVTDALYRYSGDDQYVKMISQLFNDMSGVRGTRTDQMEPFNKLFNKLSGNAVTDAIGFSLQTIEKHSPQAIYQSVAAIGVGKFIKTVAQDLLRNSSFAEGVNRDFIRNGATIGGREWKGSSELRTRRQNYREDPQEVARIMQGEMGLLERGVKVSARAGASVISTVDQQMSELTWMAKYRQMRTEETERLTDGKSLSPSQMEDATWEAHQFAEAQADLMVRMTHGSSNIVSRPEWLRSQNALVKTGAMAYNFFNNALNRRFRSIYMIQDLIHGRSPRPMMQDVRTIVNDVFTYVALPTLIEDTVDPLCKEDDSAAACTGKFAAQSLAAPIPIARDLVHSIITGAPVGYGITFNLFRYLYGAVEAGYKYQDSGDPARLGDMGENMAGLAGGLFGFPGGVLGREGHYAYKVYTGQEDLPRDWQELHEVLKKGRTEEKKEEQKRIRLLERLNE